MGDKKFLPELIAEKDNIDPSFTHATRLLNQEIESIQSGGKIGASQKENQPKYLDVTKDKPIKLTTKILVPVKEHPRFNFVGKLLGPKGSSLKRLQEETGCKMAILGRGSMRDKQKEEELRSAKDPKYAHLNDNLHVHIEVYSTPSDGHSRLAHAIAEVQKFMNPNNSEPEFMFNGLEHVRGFDSYDTPYDSYESPYPPSSLETQYFDYGHGADSAEGYDGYGNSTWGANSASRLKASPARPKTSFRDHPYGYKPRPSY